MLKWFLRILYALLIILVGYIVINDSFVYMRIQYVEDNGQEFYDSDQISEYLVEYYIATSTEKYLTYPLYQAVSNDEEYQFSLSIFHSKVPTRDGDAGIVSFVLHNLDVTVPEKEVEEENYSETNVSVRVNIQFENDTIYTYYDLEGRNIPNPSIPVSNDIFTPIPIAIITDENGDKVFNVPNGVTGAIQEIRIQLVDGRNLDEESVITTFGLFKSINKEGEYSFDDHFNVSETLVRKPITETIDGKEVTYEVMEASLFDGKLARYDLVDYYYSDDYADLVGTADISRLKEYSGIAVRIILIFVVVVVVITYLLFFLKPTIRYFRNKKVLKTLGDKEEHEVQEAIFTDKE